MAEINGIFTFTTRHIIENPNTPEIRYDANLTKKPRLYKSLREVKSCLPVNIGLKIL